MYYELEIHKYMFFKHFIRTCIILIFSTIALTMHASRCAAESVLPVSDEMRYFDIFKECIDCPEMIVLPMGDFVMGSPQGESRLNIHWDVGNIRRVTAEDPYIAKQEGPQHSVAIDIEIAIGINEITFGEWKACVEDGGCGGYMPPTFMLVANMGKAPGRFDLSDRFPVSNVSYNDIQLYLAWLNTKLGMNVYRLPTEVEWEYAARAGTKTPFAQGQEINTSQANFDGDATAEMLGETHTKLLSRGHPISVDELDADNQWGVRHMSGNLIEMTKSCWTDTHENWSKSSIYLQKSMDLNCNRVTKGGAFAAAMDYSRLGVRGRVSSDSRSSLLGFRIVRELK